MGHLKKAVTLGFADAGRIRASEDLAPLREREDFRALLKDLDAKAPRPNVTSPSPGPGECW